MPALPSLRRLKSPIQGMGTESMERLRMAWVASLPKRPRSPVICPTPGMLRTFTNAFSRVGRCRTLPMRGFSCFSTSAWITWSVLVIRSSAMRPSTTSREPGLGFVRVKTRVFTKPSRTSCAVRLAAQVFRVFGIVWRPQDLRMVRSCSGL